MRKGMLALGMLAAGIGVAQAQSLEVHGFVDLRAAAPADDTSWLDGGLGKSRFGDDDDVLAGAALALDWQATPALSAFAQGTYDSARHKPLDLIEAHVRYRPVSTTPWRWSVTAGMFFPPVSLENDGVGWTSVHTLTPSAINSWVGEELRIFGAEYRLEHRGKRGTLELRAAVFGKNDPAGELLASRGWALGDVTSGLDTNVRQPDVHAPQARAPVPMRFRPFVEIDDRIGWYAAAGWKSRAGAQARLMYYDNRTEPDQWVRYAGRRLFGWHTRFWSAGAERRIGEWTLMAQAMTGSTAFEPVPGLYLDTRFHAGYLLASWERGAWQPALRVDLFGTRQLPEGRPGALNEHGNALTAALNWRPNASVRVSGELLRIDSHRDQRRRAGLPAAQVDTQVQLGVRVFF